MQLSYHTFMGEQQHESTDRSTLERHIRKRECDQREESHVRGLLTTAEARYEP